MGLHHKYIPRVPQCVFLRWNWDPPHPLPQRVCPPPRNQGGTAGEGVGESQFQLLKKKLSLLSTLWPTGCHYDVSQNDVSHGRCVPWTMRPLDDPSLDRGVYWTMRPLDIASMNNISRPWTASSFPFRTSMKSSQKSSFSSTCNNSWTHLFNFELNSLSKQH